MIFIVWVVFCFLVAFAGQNKKVGYWGTFFISLLLSPLIGLIVAIVSSSKIRQASQTKQTKIIRCDGCREVIDGEYLVLRPKGCQDKYDYCSKECRDTYHPNYMKEKGLEWTRPED